MLFQCLSDDVADTRDNLLLVKIMQAHHTTATHTSKLTYKVNDLIMLSITNHHHKYKKKGEKQSAKFLPRYNGPYQITKINPEASTYMLDIPTNTYPLFHASELKKHIANDPELFSN